MGRTIKEIKHLIKKEKKAIKYLKKMQNIDWWFATYGNGVPALYEVIEQCEINISQYKKLLKELKNEH